MNASNDSELQQEELLQQHDSELAELRRAAEVRLCWVQLKHCMCVSVCECVCVCVCVCVYESV